MDRLLGCYSSGVVLGSSTREAVTGEILWRLFLDLGSCFLTWSLGVVELSGKWNSASVARAVSWETSGGFFFVWTRLLARHCRTGEAVFHMKQVRYDPRRGDTV